MCAVLIIQLWAPQGAATPKCVAALELLFGRQVAPLAHRYFADGNPADADAADGNDLEADGLAEQSDDTRLGGFHREAQAVFVLPAGFDRRQFLALVAQAVVQAVEPVGDHLALDLDHILLLDRSEE